MLSIHLDRKHISNVKIQSVEQFITRKEIIKKVNDIICSSFPKNETYRISTIHPYEDKIFFGERENIVYLDPFTQTKTVSTNVIYIYVETVKECDCIIL